MLGFNGGLIGKTQTISESPSLPGLWTLSEHLEAKRNNLWPLSPDPNDPNFSNVQLLLRMDGLNESTTFIDDSLSSRTITGIGPPGPKISTTESKYGGASGLFVPRSYLQMTPSTDLQFPGDFTIEVWAFPTSNVDMLIGTSPSDPNVQIFRINQDGVIGNLGIYINGVQVFIVSSGITANAWHHIAFSRNGTNSRIFVNGIQKGSTNTTWSGTFRMDLIGAFFFSGNRFYDYRGYLDDFRITKGFARYTSNFTPPNAL
jgi:hypothetical protein